MQSSGDSARLPEEARGVRQSAIVVAVKELLSVLFVMFSAAQSRERRWRASRGFFLFNHLPSEADYGEGCQHPARTVDLCLLCEGPISMTLGLCTGS